MTTRTVPLFDILGLANCAEDYGHWNNVCMYTLYEWAKPVTDKDIEEYATALASGKGYGEEDREKAISTLTEWRDKHERMD